MSIHNKMTDKLYTKCNRVAVSSGNAKYCYSCKIDVMNERSRLIKKKK